MRATTKVIDHILGFYVKYPWNLKSLCIRWKKPIYVNGDKLSWVCMDQCEKISTHINTLGREASEAPPLHNII